MRKMKSRDYTLIVCLLGLLYLPLSNALPLANKRDWITTAVKGAEYAELHGNSNVDYNSERPPQPEDEGREAYSRSNGDRDSSEVVSTDITVNSSQLLYVYNGVVGIINPRNMSLYDKMMPLANVPSGATWISYLFEEPRPPPIYVRSRQWQDLNKLGWELRSFPDSSVGLVRNPPAAKSTEREPNFIPFRTSNSTLVLVRGQEALAVVNQTTESLRAYFSLRFGELTEVSLPDPTGKKLVIPPAQLRRLQQSGWQLLVSSEDPPAYKLVKSALKSSKPGTLRDYIQTIQGHVATTVKAAEKVVQIVSGRSRRAADGGEAPAKDLGEMADGTASEGTDNSDDFWSSVGSAHDATEDLDSRRTTDEATVIRRQNEELQPSPTTTQRNDAPEITAPTTTSTAASSSKSGSRLGKAVPKISKVVSKIAAAAALAPSGISNPKAASMVKDVMAAVQTIPAGPQFIPIYTGSGPDIGGFEDEPGFFSYGPVPQNGGGTAGAEIGDIIGGYSDFRRARSTEAGIRAGSGPQANPKGKAKGPLERRIVAQEAPETRGNILSNIASKLKAALEPMKLGRRAPPEPGYIESKETMKAPSSKKPLRKRSIGSNSTDYVGDQKQEHEQWKSFRSRLHQKVLSGSEPPLQDQLSFARKHETPPEKASSSDNQLQSSAVFEDLSFRALTSFQGVASAISSMVANILRDDPKLSAEQNGPEVFSKVRVRFHFKEDDGSSRWSKLKELPIRNLVGWRRIGARGVE